MSKRSSPTAGAHTLPEEEIPEVPPMSVRGPYLSLSWGYLRWCMAMLLWAILCVGYFIVTRQWMEMGIGLCLGVLLLAMIASPATLFGGKTWYKRLGWITILTGLFSVMFAYPLIVVTIGIVQRLRESRYWPPKVNLNDSWHLVLSLLTLVVSVWTILVARRAIRLTRKLQRGDYVV
jgi:hypothetical protein